MSVMDVATTPILAFGVYQLWSIRVNHLPHIYERLGRIEGKLETIKEE